MMIKDKRLKGLVERAAEILGKPVQQVANMPVMDTIEALLEVIENGKR